MQPGVLLGRPWVEAHRCKLSHAIRVHIVSNLEDLQYPETSVIPLALECRDKLQDANNPRQRRHVKRQQPCKDHIGIPRRYLGRSRCRRR